MVQSKIGICTVHVVKSIDRIVAGENSISLFCSYMII